MVGLGQPTPPPRSSWMWLGPLLVIVAIVVLAVVALPGLGSGPATSPAPPSGITGQATGSIGTPSPLVTAGPVATDSPPGATTRPAVTGQAYPRPIPAIRRRLDRAFRRMAKEIGAPGLVAAVRLPDGSVWYGSDGVLWPGGPEATVDTPFAWGSITKTFVAALILRAATQGQLDLDQTIDTWLPEIANSDQITVRMLLAHRSGIADYFQHKDYADLVFKRPQHAWTTDEILALTGPQQYPPGKGFNYSNTNYVLLGLILERITGQPLDVLIHDQLLAPLGMDETVFQQAGQSPGLVGAKGFWKSGSGFREWSDGTDFRPTTSAATVAWAAGAMEGSARDLLDWEIALYGGQVLTPGELSQMLAFRRDSGYGLGARTQTVAGKPGYGHGGSVRGFQAVMYRLPGDDLDVVVLANVGFADLDKVANRLAKAALEPLSTPRPSPGQSVVPDMSAAASLP
jgi:D-alanyl-D-alanine carboxypeptidase